MKTDKTEVFYPLNEKPSTEVIEYVQNSLEGSSFKQDEKFNWYLVLTNKTENTNNTEK